MKLTIRQHLLMTWEITWPVALLDLAVAVVAQGMMNVQGEIADSIWAVAAFFIVSPWVVRRALARPYGAETVVVVQRSR